LSAGLQISIKFSTSRYPINHLIQSSEVTAKRFRDGMA
jgi:hypothetical protein